MSQPIQNDPQLTYISSVASFVIPSCLVVCMASHSKLKSGKVDLATSSDLSYPSVLHISLENT